MGLNIYKSFTKAIRDNDVQEIREILNVTVINNGLYFLTAWEDSPRPCRITIYNYKITSVLFGSRVNNQHPNNDEYDFDKPDCEGMTLLMCACKNGHLDVVKYLLLKDVHLGIRCNSNLTAHAYCDKSKHPKLRKLLDDVYEDFPQFLI
jgi:ankyrin repeat protein